MPTRNKKHFLLASASSAPVVPALLEMSVGTVSLPANGDVLREVMELEYGGMCNACSSATDNIAAKMFPVNDISDFHLRLFPWCER